MTVAAPSTLMDELVELVKAALDMNSVDYGPPESVPTQKYAWVRYGPVEYEYGMFGVAHPALTVTVCIPSATNYPNEYRIVNDMANTVAAALLPPVLLGNELVITGLSISEPTRAAWAGQPAAIMAAAITLESESKEQET